jgi:hypothetical protein
MNFRSYLYLSVPLAALVGCGDIEHAKSEARSYAGDLGYTVVGVSCTGTAFDGDGYVACAVRVEGEDAPMALECSRGDFTFAEGCKLVPAFKMMGGRKGQAL